MELCKYLGVMSTCFYLTIKNNDDMHGNNVSFTLILEILILNLELWFSEMAT